MEIHQLADQQTRRAWQPCWPFIPRCLAFATLLFSTCGAALADPPADASSPAGRVPRLIAESYDSGFKLAHDTYNGMGVGSDGKIYYVLCSQVYDVAGQMFSLRPGLRRDQAPRRPDGNLRRERHEGRRPGENPQQFRRIPRQALFRHPRRLLRQQGRHGRDGAAAARLETLSGRPFSVLRPGVRQVRGLGNRAARRGDHRHEHGRPTRPALRTNLAAGPFRQL